IGFEEVAEIFQKESTKVIDVSNNPNWTPIIGERIRGIIAYWDTFNGTTTTYLESGIALQKETFIKLPLVWEIEFTGRKIWISTLEIKDDRTNIFWADHLTIFFTQKAQEKYELIRKSSIKYSV
ncbi:MAG: hypothetical protein AB8G22_22175, partial [Saprospiraceae bacterium]